MARGPAIGRDRAHGDAPGRRHRSHDRAHHLAGSTALREEVEQAIALRERAHDRFALCLAIVLPLALAQARDRALQGVIELGVLPDRPLPDIGEQRGLVELAALKADIGRDVARSRIDDRACFQFAQFSCHCVQLLDRGRCGRFGLLLVVVSGLRLVAVEPVPEAALLAVEGILRIAGLDERRVAGARDLRQGGQDQREQGQSERQAAPGVIGQSGHRSPRFSAGSGWRFRVRRAAARLR